MTTPSPSSSIFPFSRFCLSSIYHLIDFTYLLVHFLLPSSHREASVLWQQRSCPTCSRPCPQGWEKCLAPSRHSIYPCYLLTERSFDYWLWTSAICLIGTSAHQEKYHISSRFTLGNKDFQCLRRYLRNSEYYTTMNIMTLVWQTSCTSKNFFFIALSFYFMKWK